MLFSMCNKSRICEIYIYIYILDYSFIKQVGKLHGSFFEVLQNDTPFQYGHNETQILT